METIKIIMKKLFLFALLSLFCNTITAQKKKTATKSVVLATQGIYTAEINKSNFNIYINNKGGKKDSIVMKTIDQNMLPNNCKITAFKAKNIALHLISWTESNTVKLPKKITVVTVSYSKVYDITTKTEVYSNVQTNTNTKEQVQLGKTTATETQERNRNEGYTLTLLPTGDIILKNKTQEKKLSYDVVSKVFK